MSYACLNAFIADSVRAICLRRPAVLKSDKKVEWSTLIELGNWNDIFTYLVETYVFKIRMGRRNCADSSVYEKTIGS